ncbi:hypothetical protein Tco_0299879 [Tanacetum coccineum]
MEEYIRLEEEKAHRRSKVYNWETATYGKIWDNEDVHDLGSIETEFPAIVINDTLTSEAALSCEPTVSSLNNDEIDFTISIDESDDEDCTVTDMTKMDKNKAKRTKLSTGLERGFIVVLVVLVTGTSQIRQYDKSESDSYYLSNQVVNSFTGTNRYPVITSSIHIESHKSPTKILFDIGSSRISIVTVNTKKYHSDVLARSQG